MQNNETVDQKVYQQLVQLDKKEEGEMRPVEYGSIFILHVVLKAIPLGLLLLKGLFVPLLGKTIIIELILIFVVLDFWFTKNINGRKMTGLRWAFQEDPYGIERMRFEGRINEQYISPLSSKLFWFIQGIYCVLPVIFLISSFLIAPNLQRINFNDILLNIAVLIGGGSNLFFFWKASSGVSDRRHELRTKLGAGFAKTLGTASVISFL